MPYLSIQNELVHYSWKRVLGEWIYFIRLDPVIHYLLVGKTMKVGRELRRAIDSNLSLFPIYLQERYVGEPTYRALHSPNIYFSVL